MAGRTQPTRSPAVRNTPRGRTAASPGGPVRDPVPGPPFRQAVTPARIRPSLPPRGRAESNPGGPVVTPENPVFTLGIPYFAWATGSMHTSGGSGG